MKHVKITEEQKKIIENNIAAFATTDHFCAPNIILLKGVKVISENQLLITDESVKELKVSLDEDPRAALLVWHLEEKLEYQFKGEVEYEDEEMNALILNVTQVWDMMKLELIAGESDDK